MSLNSLGSGGPALGIHGARADDGIDPYAVYEEGSNFYVPASALNQCNETIFYIL